jgi:hypothetical protein
MRRPAIPLAVLAALALGAAPAHAKVGTETASAGAVQATLSFDKTGDFEFTDIRLKIVRAGAALFDDRITDPDTTLIQPAGGGEGGALKVRDLDADGEPEVVVDLFTGGAHCCLDSLVYRFQADRNAYSSLEHNWGNPGYRLVDLGADGVPEFDSADDRFTDQFGPFAASWPPERIFRLQNGGFVDVTRSFPARLERGARSLYRRFRREVRRGRRLFARNVLAAYAAEEHLTGHGARANRRIRAALRRGDLRPEFAGDIPAGRAFVRKLNRVLRRYGYLSR